MSFAHRAMEILRRFGWLAAPVAAGMLVRCWNLLDQVANGDELHAVRAAVTLPLQQILVTYRPGDNCIPMAKDFLHVAQGVG